MVGLLDDNDNGKMDLGTLEKRLSDQQKNTSRRASTALSNPPTSPSHSTPGKDGNNDSPNSSLTSPEPQKEQLPKKEENSIDEQTEKKKEEEVEELSDMMCSLVTNNCGETRYIGMFQHISGNLNLQVDRVFLRLLDFLTEGHTVG